MASEQGGAAAQSPALPARRPGGVLIFVPLLIALVGLGALVLGQLPGTADRAASGYGIDEVVTGAIAPPADPDAIILLDR